ncbi:MAG: AmmeMemoRadiSam system protein B [Kiritimatiellia bacterium]
MESKVMISSIAGQWYSEHAGSLRSEIEELRNGVAMARRQQVCAVVVPHAGYRYSPTGVYRRDIPVARNLEGNQRAGLQRRLSGPTVQSVDQQ